MNSYEYDKKLVDPTRNDFAQNIAYRNVKYSLGTILQVSNTMTSEKKQVGGIRGVS